MQCEGSGAERIFKRKNAVILHVSFPCMVIKFALNTIFKDMLIECESIVMDGMVTRGETQLKQPKTIYKITI